MDTSTVEISDYFTDYENLVEELSMEHTDGWVLGDENSYIRDNFYLEYLNTGEVSLFSAKNEGNSGVLLYGCKIYDSIDLLTQRLTSAGWVLSNDCFYGVYEDRKMSLTVTGENGEIISWYLDNWPQGEWVADVFQGLEQQNITVKTWTSITSEQTDADVSDQSEKNIEDYCISDYLKSVITNAEETAGELQNSLSEDVLSQYELNQKSKQLYDYWDYALNEVWGELQTVLEEADMSALTDEELQWISDKENAVSAAGAEYAGGSMQPLVENLTAAEWTEERLYVLLEILEKEYISRI